MKTTALALAGVTAGALVVAGMALSCSTTKTTAATGLEVIIAADGLNAPADFDDVELKVSEQVDGGAWDVKWQHDYAVPSTATLPATFAIGAGSTPGEEALVAVTAFKGGATGQPVVQRVAQVRVPTDRMASLWMVLAKRCAGQVTPAGDGGEPASTCPAGESCQPGNGQCGGNVLDPASLPTYTPGEDLDAGISLGLVPGDGGTSAIDAAESGALDASDGATSAFDASDASSPPDYLNQDAIAGFAYGGNLGSPYDSVLAAPINSTQSAIAPGFQTAPGTGQIVAPQKFQLIASSADLYSALDVSPSLSVSPGLASVNAKTAFVKNTPLDTTDLWVLADFSQATAQKIVNPTLSAQAAALSPEAFYALYGDRYAAQVASGAEMFCTLQIPTISQLDKSNLTGALGFSYGASGVSSSFTTSVTSATAGRNVIVTCGSLGFVPTTAVTTLASLLSAAQAFQAGSASTLGSVSTTTLYLLYASYYGIAGYPGVPAGTAARVAAQGPIASDFLLYDSLVTRDFSAYYADPSYSSLPFFADMKAYRDALSTFLTASITNSQSPGVPVPAAAADGVVTDWATTTSLSSTGTTAPQFKAHGTASGVVPKRISDYAIPLRYAYPDSAGNGTLRGVTFPPVAPVAAAAAPSSKAPIDYPLYLVNKAGPGGGLRLEYQWDTGTYFFSNGTNGQGAPDATLIGTAIRASSLSGNLAAQYVVVSKANGLVMTDNGATKAMTATHLTSGSSSQLWKFYLQAAGTNCSTYVSPPDGGAPGAGCANGNNIGTPANAPCGSLLYGISSAATAAPRSGYWDVPQIGMAGTAIFSNGGGGCDDCNAGCAGGGTCQFTGCSGGPIPNDSFFLQPYDSGGTQAIYEYAGSQGGTVSYVVTDPAQTAAGSSTEPVVVATTIGGGANELWVFVPSTNVDTSP